jgi:pimaricinolide synthase PimS1
LLAAVVSSEEPEVAIRNGEIYVPRLAPVPDTAAESAARWNPSGTVLITGGTSGLGALVAQHLAKARGVRHLLLCSRQGADADGTAALCADLAALGAEATVAACDVTDRDAVAALLAQIPSAHPLTAVIHTAAVAGNAMLSGMTEERLDLVLRPKVDGAWNLHELTKDQDLSAFILFSSCVGLVVGAGQANYAAANRFTDALAVYRQAAGLPAVSLAFGLWSAKTSLGGGVTEDDLRRMARLGMPALSAREGLALIDDALSLDESVLVPLSLNVSALNSSGMPVPALLRDAQRLAPLPGTRPATASGGGVHTGDFASLEQRLAPLREPERHRLLEDLVRTHVATVRHSEPETVSMSRSFTEMGLDSLAGIDLRNQLESATGLRLPATLIFDYPTPGDLTAFLYEELLPGIPDSPVAEADETSIRQALESISLGSLRESGLLEALLKLAAPTADPSGKPADGGNPAADQGVCDRSEAIKNMSAEELLHKALAVSDPN